MQFELDGVPVFASTGGREHKDGQPWIIFIHGAGQSHLTWSQQVRAFAYDGYNVLALDFPAHGASGGDALPSVEAMAGWVVSVMDELKIERAHLVNHSMGGLVSLEICAKNPKRVQSIVFVATAMTIAVGDVLVKWAKGDQQKAIDMMTSLGHGAYGHSHDTSVPGTSLIGSCLEIMKHNQPDALPADLISCVSYTGGPQAATNVDCPTLCLISSVDRMVKPAFGKKLHEALSNSELIVLDNAGHMMPAERPREINQHIRDFYNNIKPAV